MDSAYSNVPDAWTFDARRRGEAVFCPSYKNEMAGNNLFCNVCNGYLQILQFWRSCWNLIQRTDCDCTY